MTEPTIGLLLQSLRERGSPQMASLWKVADAATKDRIVDFYQRVLKGAGRSAALRAA